MSLPDDIPEMTAKEQIEVRRWMALFHESDQCHIYGDDGELQCNNISRHGRCIDFRREPMTDIMNIIQATAMVEAKMVKADRPVTPAEVESVWNNITEKTS